MKKGLFVLFLLLSALPVKAEEEEEKFVNPLFYEVMEPLSTIAWETRLTPTSVTTVNSEGYTLYQKCKLVTNSETRVSFYCNEESEVITDDDNFTQDLSYIVLSWRKEYNGTLIKVMYSDINDDRYSSWYLVVSDKKSPF